MHAREARGIAIQHSIAQGHDLTTRIEPLERQSQFHFVALSRLMKEAAPFPRGAEAIYSLLCGQQSEIPLTIPGDFDSERPSASNFHEPREA